MCAKSIFGCVIFALVSILVVEVQSEVGQKNQLLFILLDAVRYDYVDRQPPGNVPGFNKLFEEGVRAKWMNPIFPSVSYPSWTTLVTGAYAETHGIVGNNIYDDKAKDIFHLFDADSTGKKKWWNKEPIWTTATKAGLSTAAIFMGRCDVPFDGVTPDYCEPFYKVKGHEILQTNMDKAIQRLNDGYDFVLLYNEYADNVGHDSGPETRDMDNAIQQIDSTILHLQNQLEEDDLADRVNIIIVSDHGMIDTMPGVVNRIEIDDYLPTELIEKIVENGAFANIKVADKANIEEVRNIPGKIIN